MKKLSPQTKRALCLITFGVVLFAVLLNLGSVLGVLKAVASVFSTVIIGLCIAFILNVLLSALESKPFAFMGRSKKKFVRVLKRPVCMVLTYLIALGIVTIMLLIIIPELYRTVIYIGDRLPAFASEAQVWLRNTLIGFGISADVIPEFQINWTSLANSVTEILAKNYNNIFGNAVNITTSVAGSLANVFFGIMISIYILAQKERIGRFVKKCIDAFLPDRMGRGIYHVAEHTKYAFSRFIGGQCMEAVILGVLCFVGMLILSIPNAAVVSVLICVTALVPIVGATVGAVVGFLLILVTNPIKAVVFIIFLLALQQIEGTLIYPRVVGKSVGLPGVIVICAVIVGGQISGILGALIGVPVCAVLYTLINEMIEYTKKQKETEEKIPDA